MANLFNLDDLTGGEKKENPASGSKVKGGVKSGMNKEKFVQLLPKLDKDTTWHMPSRGAWSTHLVIEHLLKLTGPARVAICTWAISEKPAIHIVKALDDGRITDLSMLIDHRLQSHSPEAYQVLLANNHRAKIGLTSIHAKVTLISNKNWNVTVIGSANLTVNRRIEVYSITESKTITEQHWEWIMQEIYQSKSI